MTDTARIDEQPDRAAVTIPQAAELLGCSAQAVRNWLAHGVLDGYSQQLAQRKRWRVDLDSVLALRAQRHPAIRAAAPLSPTGSPEASVRAAEARAAEAEARARRLEAVLSLRAETHDRLTEAFDRHSKAAAEVQAALLGALAAERQATDQFVIPDDVSALT